MRKALYVTTALATIGNAYAQSQDQMNAIASATWAQVMGDNVAECGMNGSGPMVKGLTTGVNCVPLTLAPGDILPGTGQSVGFAGNTWSLACKPGEDGTGCWAADLIVNGQTCPGYWMALRMVNGTLTAEQSKGSGWQVVDPSNPCDNGNTWAYTPGAKALGQSTASDTQTATTPVPAPSGSYNLAPFADTACPTQTFTWQAAAVAGAATPGNGSFSAGGSTYTVDATNGNVAAIDGIPINDGAYETAQLVQGSDGGIYGQSLAANNAGQWFLLSSDGAHWQPLDGVPAAISGDGGNGQTVSSGPLNTQQTFAQALGYFEATIDAGGSFSLAQAGSTTTNAIRVGAATDGLSHVYGAAITKNTTTLYADAQQVSQTNTSSLLPLYLVGTAVESARAFPNINDALACVSDWGSQSAAQTPPQQATQTVPDVVSPAVLPMTAPPPTVMPADPTAIPQQLIAVQAQINAAQAKLDGLTKTAPQ